MENTIKTHKKLEYYWIPLIIAVLIPIVINCIAMVVDVGTQVLRDSVIGEYKRFGIPYNPWPDIIPGFIYIVASIALITWGIIKIASWSFIGKRSIIVRYLVYFLLSLIGSITISYGMNFLALSWLGAFHDYNLGLPVSRFVFDWSSQLGIPVETVLLFLAFILKKK
jgi:hypothetical protein